MTEREQPARVAEVEAPAQATQRKPHERLAALVSSAKGATSDEDRQLLAKDVVDALVAMRAPGDEQAEARVVVQHLDANALDGLVDEDGRHARHEAVETLLSLGFPHALKVRPEDLAFFRSDEGRSTIGGRALREQKIRNKAWWIVLCAQGLNLALASQASTEAFSAALIASLSGGLGALLLAATKPRRDNRGVATALLVASAVASAFGVTMMGPWALAIPIGMAWAIYPLLDKA